MRLRVGEVPGNNQSAMKPARLVLLASLGVLVCGSAALWYLGGSPIQFRAEVQIGRPPDHVFPFLIDPRKLVLWIGGLVDSKPLTEGGPRRGAKSIETVEENGRRFEMSTEILQFEPDRELEARIHAEMGEVISRFRLTSVGDGTRLEQTMTARFTGVYRLFGLLLRGPVQKKLAEDLARLKEKAEATR